MMMLTAPFPKTADTAAALNGKPTAKNKHNPMHPNRIVIIASLYEHAEYHYLLPDAMLVIPRCVKKILTIPLIPNSGMLW
ncbi:hypothetical protein KIH73_02725 [Bifidobacterium sp. 6T3]|uniref:Uncharacterized protein n=1 Tax=Bifidobacterium phasiani TaxID=2834431 RepID=A0ABS6W721_9BIFI|nr:hypothetical protein [Bifidobacterium phasiani]